MKKVSHLVICPKCSKAVEMENLIQHINSHSAAPVRNVQQIGDAQKPIAATSPEESSLDQGA